MKTKDKKSYFIIGIILFLLFIMGTFFNSKDINIIFIDKIKNITINIFKYSIKPIFYIEEKINYISINKDLNNSYNQLLNRIQDYEILISENENLKLEINELKENLELNKVLASNIKVNATVIERNVSSWLNTLVIDKGKQSGIDVGMIVINANGLIGKIDKVYDDNSIVKLITSVNNDYKLSVYINDCHGLINSYNAKTNLMSVTSISSECIINTNNKVITSGLATNYPSGILVGYVSDVGYDSYKMSKVVYVKSSQNFNNIKYVMVVGDIK